MRKLYLPLDVNKYSISQGFGISTPETKKFYDALGMKGHNGLDFSCPIGTPIYAAHGGKAKVYTSVSGGNSIMLTGMNVKTFYCHLSEFKVIDGHEIKAGELIALSGNTGQYTTGAHLHFGVYPLTYGLAQNGYNGAVDPLPYLVDLCEEGELIKLPSNNLNFPSFDRAKVFEIFRGKRYWIEDENSFLWRYDYPVGKAKIKEVDALTYNYYRYGGRIRNDAKYVAET